ncbi:MAG: WYL domain-containing protein [Muribaculaceae bacterium]|nr:WYL domain-containing protein [Muribaculaceae bacterium]
MARNLVARYIWIIDTIERHGALSLQRLNKLWEASELNDGKPISRRTFYNYRESILDTFGITIECNNATFEYFINHDESDMENRRQQWLLDSMSISGMLSDSSDIASRIVLESVPSARKHLPVIIDAMRANSRIAFSYKGYTRLTAKKNVVEPYFVKIFRQLWYVIGRNMDDNMIKTYALDRMTDLQILDSTFTYPATLRPDRFFKHCYGITSSTQEPIDIMLRVEATQAKYFRALPLHPSQSEVVHDRYSIFHYKMCNTFDLRERLLSHGAAVEVLQPVELRKQIVKALRDALNNYMPQKKNIGD